MHYHINICKSYLVKMQALSVRDLKMPSLTAVLEIHLSQYKLAVDAKCYDCCPCMDSMVTFRLQPANESFFFLLTNPRKKTAARPRQGGQLNYGCCSDPRLIATECDELLGVHDRLSLRDVERDTRTPVVSPGCRCYLLWQDASESRGGTCSSAF